MWIYQMCSYNTNSYLTLKGWTGHCVNLLRFRFLYWKSILSQYKDFVPSSQTLTMYGMKRRHRNIPLSIDASTSSQKWPIATIFNEKQHVKYKSYKFSWYLENDCSWMRLCLQISGAAPNQTSHEQADNLQNSRRSLLKHRNPDSSGGWQSQ